MVRYKSLWFGTLLNVAYLLSEKQKYNFSVMFHF